MPKHCQRSDAPMYVFDGLLSQSRGSDGYACLPHDTQQWLAGLRPQLPERFWVHQDAAARQAARLLGADGFVRGNRIYLDEASPERLETVLRHELVHLAQVQVALHTGHVARSALAEHEADAIGRAAEAAPVRHGASPHRIYPFIWFVAIGVGMYVLLRPSVANAPGPKDPVLPSPSTGQIVFESLCFFAVPGGALALGGKLGLGFLASSAFAGAATNVSLRITGDAFSGHASPPLMYLFDATTGAAVGFIVPGGVQLIGKAGTFALDRLSTLGLSTSDIALSKVLVEEALKQPMKALTAARAQEILGSRGLAARVSKWWLDRRNLILLYRGQGMATPLIESPLAQQEGTAASEALVAHLRQLGLDYPEIASQTAMFHHGPYPGFMPPAGIPATFGPGAAGIPSSTIPAVAARFGALSEQGVVYVIRVPKSVPVKPSMVWQGLEAEDEYVFLNRIPPGAVVQMIPVTRIPAIVVDGGLLKPFP
jgi:hypothetical protein